MYFLRGEFGYVAWENLGSLEVSRDDYVGVNDKLRNRKKNLYLHGNALSP